MQNGKDGKVREIINGGCVHQQKEWSAWDTACLTQFALDNPTHPINARMEIHYIRGKSYDEKFYGERANPANYTYPTVGTVVTLDGEELP